jgi:hypothetical protein
VAQHGVTDQIVFSAQKGARLVDELEAGGVTELVLLLLEDVSARY